MNVLQAIKIINRRSETLKKLFGSHSDIYEDFSTEIVNYQFREKNETFLLNANKANKAEYRKLTAWAKRLQKTPYAVLKRKADKIKEQFFDDDFFDFDEEYNTDDDIKNLDVYYKWLATCVDYFDSCYTLARMNGFEGRAAYDYGKQLYDNRADYVRQWNYFYNTGAFKEFETQYSTDAAKQVYDIDENGELQPKKGFYRGL